MMAAPAPLCLRVEEQPREIRPLLHELRMLQERRAMREIGPLLHELHMLKEWHTLRDGPDKAG